MNKCPYCGTKQIDSAGKRILNFIIIKKRNITCEHCKSNIVIIEQPFSNIMKILALLLFLLIYFLLKQAIPLRREYSMWHWVFGLVLLFLGAIIIPSNYIITTPTNTKPVEIVERKNLLTLGGLFLLIALVWCIYKFI